MNTDELLDYDDLGEALREDRALRPARGYRIRFAQGDLDFRPLDVPDPLPLGRQILASAGLDPRDGVSLFAILASGDFEDVRLDEPFDLRERGAERFVAFHTDRDYKLTLNDDQLEWGKPAIGGVALYALAKVDDDEAVFLEVRGGEDRLIGRDEVIDLTAPGIERFLTAPKPGRAKFEITVIYNGLPKTLKVRSTDVVATVLTRARELFGSPGGDLILLTEAGQELAPAQTLGQAKVGPDARLILRARVVQGG